MSHQHPEEYLISFDFTAPTKLVHVAGETAKKTFNSDALLRTRTSSPTTSTSAQPPESQ